MVSLPHGQIPKRDGLQDSQISHLSAVGILLIEFNIISKGGKKKSVHTRWSSLSWFGLALDDVEKSPLASEAHARHPGPSTAGREEKKPARFTLVKSLINS